MYYVCDKHEVAFEREIQAKAHWNFQHERDDPWVAIDKDAIMREEIPEGYQFREYPLKEHPLPEARERVFSSTQVTRGTATPAAPRLNIRFSITGEISTPLP